MPEGGPFLRSAFTRSALREFLTDLKVKSGATRNRHRNVLHAWTRWLSDEHDGVLDLKPVSSLKRAEEKVADHLLQRSRRQALMEAVSGESQVVEAVIGATGMEWSAVERLRRRDVDTEQRTLHARGGENYWRDRQVVCRVDWCWPYIERHCKTLTPDALMFTFSHEHALDAHHAAVKAKKLAKTTLHDCRRTHAILMRRRGLADHLIAKQLGHRDATLIATRYARFTPDTAEVGAAGRRIAGHSAGSPADTTHGTSIQHQIAAVK